MKKKRDIFYIVFKTDTLAIIEVNKWYNKLIHNAHHNKQGIDYLNVTHPLFQDKLKEINKVNNTNYS